MNEAEWRSDLLRVLADPLRLEILRALGETGGHLNVDGLGARLGRRASNLSQHFTVLRRAGLVARERRGQETYYRLADPEVLARLDYLVVLLDRLAVGRPALGGVNSKYGRGAR